VGVLKNTLVECAKTRKIKKSQALGMAKGRAGVSIGDRLHGSQVSKARPGAPFDFYRREKLIIPHLTRLRQHQRMFYKGEVKWGNLKL
jgi:hypothetical protein